MEKFLEVTYLYDFYQELLTEKQRDLISGYYFDDLSLGELASQHNISRQSVFDSIKKTQQKLLDYEEKLKLWYKYQKQRKILEHMKELTKEGYQIADERNDTYLTSLSQLIEELMNEM